MRTGTQTVFIDEAKWIPVMGDPEDLESGVAIGILAAGHDGRYWMKESKVGGFYMDTKGKKEKLYVEHKWISGIWFRVDTNYMKGGTQ